MRLLLLLLAACATATPAASPERIAALKQVEEPADVKGCKLLGRFTGVSAQPGEAGLAQANTEARSKAVNAGATHVLVADETQTPDMMTVALKAYACPAGQP